MDFLWKPLKLWAAGAIWECPQKYLSFEESTSILLSLLHNRTYNVCVCARALVHNSQHPAWACSALMQLLNWVKMWKVNYKRISCYAINGWKIPPSLTSSSPHPETPKTSHDFQLVHLKVNRFNISDLCHLSTWLAVATAWAPVVIYPEVVIQPSGSCIYALYPPDPLNAPHSNNVAGC